MPGLTFTPTTSGILYPTPEGLTDDIYASVFSGERPSDAEIKHGELAGFVADIDLQWLIGRKRKVDPDVEIPTEPRVRTHLYLVEVANLIETEFDSPGDVLELERHYLGQHFPGGEHIGTPLSYTDINVTNHPDGIVLTSLGGGHAGNRASSLSGSGATPLYSGIEGWFGAGWAPGEQLVKVPLEKLIGIVARCGALAGYGSEKEILKELSKMAELTTPEEFDNHSFIIKYPDAALPERVECRTDTARIEIRLGGISGRTEREVELEQLPKRDKPTKIYKYPRDSRSFVDDDGIATYSVNRDDSGYLHEDPNRVGLSFSIASRTPVHHLSTTTNAKIENALQYLESQAEQLS